MARHKVVSAVTRMDLTEPCGSYREALDAARSVAQRFVHNVIVVNADTGAEVMIVEPSGRTINPNSR